MVLNEVATIAHDKLQDRGGGGEEQSNKRWETKVAIYLL